MITIDYIPESRIDLHDVVFNALQETHPWILENVNSFDGENDEIIIEELNGDRKLIITVTEELELEVQNG